jgi:hypothetical protein
MVLRGVPMSLSSRFWDLSLEDMPYLVWAYLRVLLIVAALSLTRSHLHSQAHRRVSSLPFFHLDHFLLTLLLFNLAVLPSFPRSLPLAFPPSRVPSLSRSLPLAFSPPSPDCLRATQVSIVNIHPSWIRSKSSVSLTRCLCLQNPQARGCHPG